MKQQSLMLSVIKTVLCSVSMILTALFALSFSSPLGSLGSPLKYLPYALTVSIGLSIDLSKYVFWFHRAKHPAFYITAVVLLVFSCAASIAFFITQERQGVEIKRLNTETYQAHRLNIELLREDIKTQRALIETRLKSRFHDQWDKGTSSATEVSIMREKLVDLIAQSSLIGLQEARIHQRTSAFFVSLSVILNMSFDVTVLLCYATLAFLIEWCALGMIALSGSLTGRGSQESSDKGEPLSASQEALFQTIQSDIVGGRVPPIARRLIAMYPIRHPFARDVLKSLEKQKKLKKRGRTYHVVDALD